MSASPTTSEPGQDPDRGPIEVLLKREQEIGELLLCNSELRHEIATWFEPCLELRRRELDDLKRKLDDSEAEYCEAVRPRELRDAPGEARAGEIAVVIVCRDHGRTVEVALTSAWEQTRWPSEVILVDDGSSGLDSRHVLARLGKQGHQVLALPEPNAVAARNLGIRSTRAPLVVTVDADAVLEPSCLEKAATVLARHPEHGFVAMERCEAFEYGEVPAGALRPLALADCLASAGGRCTSVVRRRLWESLGGYDEELAIYEEKDFQARALEQGVSGAILDELLIDYPRRPDSATHGALDAHTHISAMERFYARHAAALERHAEEVLGARQRFLHRERRRLRHLTEAKEKIERELEEVAAEAGTLRRRLRAQGRSAIDWGDLRRTAPLSHYWGVDRGLPVDRTYVEAFLDRHREDIQGHVLEIRDAGYTATFGDNRVVRSDVLDISPDNPEATIVTDLARADTVAEETFDCFILTQTLNVIYDFREALRHACRILKPGAVLLCTVSATNRITYGPGGRDSDHWRFTEASLRRLFAELVPLDAFEITPYGNVLACVAFLYGMTAGELTREELAETDPYFPLIYAVRVVKPLGGPAAAPGPGTCEAEGMEAHLAAARYAWLEAMEPYRDGLGCIALPDTPMLEPRHLEGCRVLAHRRSLIEEMKRHATAAEVGVQTGAFSRTILDSCQPRKLHLVDVNLAAYGIEDLFAEEIARGQVEIHEGDSSTILSGFPDRYFDFVYIDADHSYTGVSRDIEVAKTKIRDDGYLIFNDYTYWSPCEGMRYGVVQAVNELCLSQDWRVEYFALGPYMYCDVAIRRR